MVSLQATTLFSLKEIKSSPSSNFGDPDPSKLKRKRQDAMKDVDDDSVFNWCNNKSTIVMPLAVADIELHLEDTPLPPEWQRCLDIKSGQLHYYNSRTRTRTCRDPRVMIDLDLQLNLGCNRDGGDDGIWKKSEREVCSTEMVAMVCFRCHMLVMIRRPSPSCPNCKFAQSLDDGNQERKCRITKSIVYNTDNSKNRITLHNNLFE